GRDEPVGQELAYLDFENRLTTLALELSPTFKNAEGKNPAREAVLTRIAARRQQAKRTPGEAAALAADLVRVGDLDAAEALLARDRHGYLANVTLAHIYATKGGWEKAYDYLVVANGEDPPEALKGLSPAQLDWQLRLNRGPLLRLYKARAVEAQPGRKPSPQTEDVDPVFPVRFVTDKGEYAAGNLSAAERAKLPADAIATVQQMMLWAPTDARLYWLLAELYAADGRYVEAKAIFDKCVSEARQYGNRKVLRDHRAAVQPLAEEQAKKRTAEVPLVEPTAAAEPAAPPPEEPPVQPPIGLGAVWVYFGVVAAVAVLAAVRVFGRRGKGHSRAFR
ncbi:MAG: tetratricopeptide repeat protein, partial [Gemmataceae bacterium]|nr:tetratricopeptide repeat protein [Gemmataceae bacterium]